MQNRPIFSADFHPGLAQEYIKHAHPMGRTIVTPGKSSTAPYGSDKKAWRLATAGGDNVVRVRFYRCVQCYGADCSVDPMPQIWLVTPTADSNVATPAAASTSSATAAAKELASYPRVEYLASLSRHSAVVNVVRFSPSGMQTLLHPSGRQC